MKLQKGVKTLAALIILALAAMLIAYPLIQWAPPKPILRQVNPATEAEQPPLPNFMALLVANMFDSLIGGNYTAAAETLKTLNVAYIPEKYRFTVSRFMQLMNETSSLLNQTGLLLDQAEALIMEGRGEDAKPLLQDASLKLASANATCIELKSACNMLAESFNLPAEPLHSRVDALSMLIQKLYLKLLGLLEMLEKQTTLKDTFLIVDAAPKTVWTGGSITVTGRLWTEDGGLNGRHVQIYVDEAKLATALTGMNGVFQANVSLPYIYKPTVPLQAKYAPEGLDSETLKPAASNMEEISLLYIQPTVKLEAAGRALPGKSFNVKGMVEAEMPLPYSAVKLSWAGASVNVSLLDGCFEAALYTPAEMPEGQYCLKVEAPAWQIYAPAQATVNVTVERLPLNVTLQPPKIMLAGFTMPLEGKALYGPERFNFTVQAVFAGQAYTLNSSGEFSIGLTAPLTLLSGYKNYEVYVTPDLPWYRSVALKGSVLVVNPLALLVPVGLVSALVLNLSRARKRESIETASETFSMQEGAKPSGKAYYVSHGLEWLIDMYWQAVAIVSHLTGVEPSPSMTMREYLEAAGPKLDALRAAFEALTLAAEKTLYSPAVTAEELEVAKKAFEALKVAHVEVQL